MRNKSTPKWTTEYVVSYVSLANQTFFEFVSKLFESSSIDTLWLHVMLYLVERNKALDEFAIS